MSAFPSLDLPDTGMTGIPESAWLYTRGSQSVRLVRDEHSHGCRLVVHGPGTEVATYEFADVAECMKRQPEIELNLLAAGYQLEQSLSDRRSGHRTWHETDHHQDDSDRRSLGSV